MLCRSYDEEMKFMTDIQVTEEKRNDLFGRVEITGIVAKKEGTTPSRAELSKLLAEKFKSKEDHIEIDGIYQKFGKQEAILKAKIWDKPIVKAQKPKEGEAAQTQPSVAPAAENK